MRPIYKSYPVYAHGGEPKGYLDWLETQEPVVLWNDSGTAPRLETDADWVRAGKLVFDAPLVMDVNFAVEDVLRSAAWLAHTRGARGGWGDAALVPVRRPARRGSSSWAAPRVASATRASMPAAEFVEGAQGNLPMRGQSLSGGGLADAAAPDKEQYTARIRAFLSGCTPRRTWPGPRRIGSTQCRSTSWPYAVRVVPAGRLPRHRGNSFIRRSRSRT